MVLAVIGIWMIGCGLTCLWLARRKGIPGGDLWFFSGMLFGLFGVLYCVFSSPKKDNGLPDSACMNCGAVNPLDAAFCEECGGEISLSLGSELPPPTSRLDNWRSKHPQ